MKEELLDANYPAALTKPPTRAFQASLPFNLPLLLILSRLTGGRTLAETMATTTAPQIQKTAVEMAVRVTEKQLAVVLNNVIGPVTDETTRRIWSQLALGVGLYRYRRSAPHQVETSEARDLPGCGGGYS